MYDAVVGLKPRPVLPSFALVPGALLRPLRRADADELYTVVDSDRERLRQWLPWLDFVRESRAMTAFIEDSEQAQRAGSATRMAIEVDGRIAGVAGLESVDVLHRRGMIGYWIDASHEGRGYVSAAVRRLCDYGFFTRGLHRIEIRAAPGNLRSRAIPERLGFQQEGIARQTEWLYDRFVDHVMYAMLAPEWAARVSAESVGAVRKRRESVGRLPLG